MKIYKHSPRFWMAIIVIYIALITLAPAIITRFWGLSDRTWNWLLFVAEIAASLGLVFLGFVLGNVLWSQVQSEQENQRTLRDLYGHFSEVHRLAHTCETLRLQHFQDPEESLKRDNHVLSQRDQMKTHVQSLAFTGARLNPDHPSAGRIETCRRDIVDRINQLLELNGVRGENEKMSQLFIQLIRLSQEGMNLTTGGG